VCCWYSSHCSSVRATSTASAWSIRSVRVERSSHSERSRNANVLRLRACGATLRTNGSSRCEPSRRARLTHQERQHGAELVAHFPTVDDDVDRAVVDEELGALEAIRQRLAHGLLDDARAGKADLRLRLADVDVAEHAETGRDAAGGRMRQHRDVRHAGAA